MKILSDGSKFVAWKMSKNENFSKNKNTPANYIKWANYCNTERADNFRTEKMPPDYILRPKIRKSVVFSKKVVITFSHFVLWTFFLLRICWPMDGQQGVVPPWKPLRPVCDELRDPKPEKHLSDTLFWPFSKHHKSTSDCCRAVFFSWLFLPNDVLSACSHLQY